MAKRLIDDILNGTETEDAEEEKGMCQMCGHYTLIKQCRMGMKVCEDCEDRIEEDLKRDYL